MKLFDIASRLLLPAIIGTLPLAHGFSAERTDICSTTTNKSIFGWFQCLRGPQGIPGPMGPQGIPGPMGPQGQGFESAYSTHEGGFAGSFRVPDPETFTTVPFIYQNGPGKDEGIIFDAEQGILTVTRSGIYQVYGQYDLHTQDDLIEQRTRIESSFLVNVGTNRRVEGMPTRLQISTPSSTTGSYITGSHQAYVELQAGETIGLFLTYRGGRQPVLDYGNMTIQMHRIANATMCD